MYYSKEVLKVWHEGKEEIQERMNNYPSLKEYYGKIAAELGCKIEDLDILSVHPDNEEHDEEGWEIESFFPAGTKVETTILDSNYQSGDFAVGSVANVETRMGKFIAESNSSPWYVYVWLW